MPSLEQRLGDVPGRHAAAPSPAGAIPTVADPVALLRHLETSGRFHRDAGVGRIFHPGSISFRENVATNSLHIVVRDNHIAAHVDLVSPLGLAPQRPVRYSVRRAVAHNAVGMAQDLLRVLRGRQGDHRSALECDWFGAPPGEEPPTPEAFDVVDPREGAWSLHIEARLRGHVDPARLRSALTAACGETGDPDLLRVVDCPDGDCLDRTRVELQDIAVQPDQCPPLRAVLARRSAPATDRDRGGDRGGDVLMMNLNHAASDGIGALGVLSSVAASYVGGACDPARREFLAVRDLPVRPAAGRVSRSIARYRRVVEVVRDLLARPALLAADGATDEPGCGFQLCQLSAEETGRIIRRDRPGTSRNILLAGLHLAIGEWNLRHGAPGGRIGVLVPADLRPPEWDGAPIANFTVTARVSTSRHHRSSPETALRAVTAQKTRNKRTRTGIALLAGLERSGLLALWAKQSLIVLAPATHNRLVDTAMLADLGWLDELADFGDDAGPVESVWFSPPARTPLCLCIGAVTLGGRLHLTLRYPQRVFGPEAARQFAECYLAQLQRVADAGAPWHQRQPPR